MSEKNGSFLTTKMAPPPFLSLPPPKWVIFLNLYLQACPLIYGTQSLMR